MMRKRYSRVLRNTMARVVLGALAVASIGTVHGLTDGPTQTEFQTFLPVDIKDMVNLSTGDFSYNIPLCVIPTADGLGFPLSLNYMAGIGMNQEASWTGLGWNLNAGSINRVPSNIPDDLNGPILFKKANVEKAEVQSHSLLFPGGNVTFSTSGHGAGQVSMSSSMNIDFDSKDKNSAKPKGGSYPVFDLMSKGAGLSKEGGGNTSPSGSQLLGIRGYTAYATINGFGYSQTNLTYRFSHDARVEQYGFLYKGANTMQYSAKEAFQVSDLIAMSDESSLYPYLHISDQTMVTGNPDSYVCMAQGLTGTFQPSIRSFTWQATPWNNLLTDDLMFDENAAIVGYQMTKDFRDIRTSITPNDFKFNFLDDPGGASVPEHYYSPAGDGFDSDDSPRSRKIFPIYGTGTDDAGLLVGFRIINEKGVTYTFGLPLFVYAEYSESSSSATGIRAGKYAAQFMPEGAGSPTVTAAQLKAMVKPLYAHSWLLTSIAGPDYMDKGAAGFDTLDAGYWVKFDYEKIAGGHVYRTPFSGKLTSSGYSLPFSRDENRYSLSFGRKDLAYLRNITTNRAVVIFDVSRREDGFESGNLVAGGVRGTNGYYRLESINVFKNTSRVGSKGANGVWDLNEFGGVPYKKIVFGYDYSLCDNTENNDEGNGKLTLKSVTLHGKDISLPPYRFSYGQNPDYSKEKWDRWGFYKSDGANDPGEPFPRHMDVNPSDVSAWSLNAIKVPSGGSLEVQYESDAYNYVHNMAIGSERKAMGSRADVNEMGHFFAEDERPAMPSGDGVYEIRSYAPNLLPKGVISGQDGIEKIKANIGKFGMFERYVPEESTRELRKVIIYANEVPPGFTVSEIKAFAYVSKGGESGPGNNPEIGVEMYGYEANGNKVPLITGNRNAIASPQWISRTSNQNLPGEYVRYEIYATVREDLVGDPSGLQRDFRIFFIDNTATKLAPGEYMKFGGGLRVKRMRFHPFPDAPIMTKDYFYDDAGDGTGINSGVASKEPDLYNNEVNDDRYLQPHLLGALVPVTKVYYGTVTVRESDKYSSKYTFITPKTAPITVRSEGRFLDWDDPQPLTPEAEGFEIMPDDYLTQERMYNILDHSQTWGLVSAIDEMNSSGAIVRATKNFYTGALGQAYNEYMGPACLNYLDGDLYFTHTSKHKTFTPLLDRVEQKVDNAEFVRYTRYNPANGLPEMEGVYTPSGSIDRASRITYAFQASPTTSGSAYEAMGHKNLESSSNKNMLSQVSSEFEVKGSRFGTEQVVKKRVFTWDYDPGSAGSQIQRSGEFNWVRNFAGGTVPSAAFPFNAPPWSNSNPLWRLVARYTDYDHFGHLTETQQQNGAFHSAVYGYGNYLQIGALINCKASQGSVYSGDYQSSNGAYLDQANGWERGEANDAGLPNPGVSLYPRSHFGKEVLWVGNAYGPTRNVEYDRTRPYVFSAWVRPNRGQCKIYVDLRRQNLDGSITVIPGSPSYSTSFSFDGTRRWRYVETVVPVSAANPAETQFLRGFVGCPDAPGGATELDGIRFAPADAMITTFFYDLDLGKPLTIVDENNVPRFFEYDGLGQLTAIRNADGAIVQEQHQVLGKGVNSAGL